MDDDEDNDDANKDEDEDENNEYHHEDIYHVNFNIKNIRSYKIYEHFI